MTPTKPARRSSLYKVNNSSSWDLKLPVHFHVFILVRPALSPCVRVTDISSRISPFVAASLIKMSGTHVTHTSDLDGRIARLDEGAARIMRFHSGNKPELLLEALEDHYSRTSDMPVIQIPRKPSCNGRPGAMDTVKCGLCAESGKFQKIAAHIVNKHFRLSLWHCDMWYAVLLTSFFTSLTPL